MTQKPTSSELSSSSLPQKKEEYDHHFVELQEQISLSFCQKDGGSWSAYSDDHPISPDEFSQLQSHTSQCIETYLQEVEEKLSKERHEELSILFTQLLAALEEGNLNNDRKKLPFPMTSLLHRMHKIIK